MDGLSGFAETLHAAYLQASADVHRSSGSRGAALRNDRGAVVVDLKKIFQAATVKQAESALEDFAQAWDDKYPTISKMWRANWTDIITFFNFPGDS